MKSNPSKNRIRIKLHEQGPDMVLAAADEECLGKKHAGGGRVLDLVKYASFYGEETVSAGELAPHLSRCTSANLVGEGACAAAIRMGLAQERQVVKIGGVPHLQIYRKPG